MTPETSLPDPLIERIKQAMRRASEGTPLAGDTAQTDYHTAMDLCEMVGTDETRLTDLEEQHDLFILDWAIELPFQLARADLVDEAATLAERFAAITEADNFLPDRAIILAEAGRREEALAQVTDNLQRFAGDPWVTIKSGDVYEQLGDLDQAEQLYRRGLELAGDDTYTRAGAVERLIPLLDKTGRKEEGEALIEAEEARKPGSPAVRHPGIRCSPRNREHRQPRCLATPPRTSSRNLTTSRPSPCPTRDQTPKSAATTPAPAAAEQNTKNAAWGKHDEGKERMEGRNAV